MGVVSGLVLFAVIWFMVLFIMLPINEPSQAEEGKVEPGTHAGAPANFNFRKKARKVTAISAVLWVLIAGVIFSGKITVRDLDWFGRMGPATQSE